MVKRECATCIYYKPGENQQRGVCENSNAWYTSKQGVFAEGLDCKDGPSGSQWRGKLDLPTDGQGQPPSGEPKNGNSPGTGNDMVTEILDTIKRSIGEMIAGVSEKIKQFVAGIVATEPQNIPAIVVALFCGLIVFICILAFFDLFLGIPILPEITVVVLLLLSGLGAVIWLIRHPEKLRGDKSTRTQKRL